MKREHYWYFEGDSVEKLRARLDAASHKVRLEVWQDKERGLLLQVVEPGVKDGDPPNDPINESHECPGSPGC